jgi:hypothetical protein
METAASLGFFPKIRLKTRQERKVGGESGEIHSLKSAEASNSLSLSARDILGRVVALLHLKS